MAHVHPFAESHPPASPSKDQSGKNRRLPPGAIMFRKTLAMLTILCALAFVVIYKPPKIPLSSDEPSTGADGTSRATKVKNKPIRLIAILGERNSGTRWTFDHLTECYNHTIEVRKGLTRYKHWFQYDNETKYPHDTLVLAQFRNPYDWFKAMEHVPHHAPAHLRTKPGASTDDHSANNDWKTFLTKPWTMPRYGADLKLKGDEMCQEDFLYRDIVSCVEDPLPESYYKYTLRYSENQPFYEMRNDGSGLPYNNIMELRTDKIRNFLDTVKYNGVSDVWTLQYEYLVSIGTQHLLDRITEWTGVKANCKAIPPQVRKPKGSRMIRADFAAHIRENLNWTVEEWIGYSPELKYEQAPSQWRRRQLRQSPLDAASNVVLMDDETWNDYEFNNNDDDEYNYEEE